MPDRTDVPRVVTKEWLLNAEVESVVLDAYANAVQKLGDGFWVFAGQPRLWTGAELWHEIGPDARIIYDTREGW